jgi:hypothetical protein
MKRETTMPQSWEYYQQTEAGNAYPLYWLCGLGGSVSGARTPALVTGAIGFFQETGIYAIPFDQMRAVIVSKVFIDVVTASPNNGKVRLGIYRSANEASPQTDEACFG